jgi:energy-coupling factor transport system permease protein
VTDVAATTGYFIPGTSWLHRRYPLTKLLGLLLVLLAAFLLPPIVLVAMVVALTGIAASAGLLRATVHWLRIPAILLASIVLINALLFPGGAEPLLTVGPLSVTVEGLTFGVVSAGRLLAVFIAAVLFLLTTPADDLLEALVVRGASPRIAFVVASAVQLVPRTQARASAIQSAQQARGLRVDGSMRTRLRALVPLIGPVVLGSLADARERAFALESRGFGARPGRTAYRVVVDPPADRWLRLALGLGCVATVLAAVSGWSP